MGKQRIVNEQKLRSGNLISMMVMATFAWSSLALIIIIGL
jgi:hypothetical protein